MIAVIYPVEIEHPTSHWIGNAENFSFSVLVMFWFDRYKNN
jgi:hypothetical protein